MRCSQALRRLGKLAALGGFAYVYGVLFSGERELAGYWFFGVFSHSRILLFTQIGQARVDAKVVGHLNDWQVY